MEYVWAGCIAVIFLIVLILIRDVRQNSASIRTLQSSLSPLQPEKKKMPELSAADSEGGIPPEIVAAISAAVYCMNPGARIVSLRRVPAKPSSAWRTAGLLENTRPF